MSESIKSEPPHVTSETPYAGVTRLAYTQVPDDLLDWVMADLTGAEFKVMMFVVRQTFGWGKDDDAISLSQLADGIVTREGRRSNRGTGLSRSTVKTATLGLVAKGVLVVTKVRAENGEYDTNVYSLNIKDGVGRKSAHPRSEIDAEVGRKSVDRRPKTAPSVGRKSAIQETVSQEPLRQETNDAPSEEKTFHEKPLTVDPHTPAPLIDNERRMDSWRRENLHSRRPD